MVWTRGNFVAARFLFLHSQKTDSSTYVQCISGNKITISWNNDHSQYEKKLSEKGITAI